MTHSRHILDHCHHCRTDMVRCATCANNCCNAGHGTLEDGSPCPDCEEAYEHQTSYFEDPNRIEFSEDHRAATKLAFAQSLLAELWAELSTAGAIENHGHREDAGNCRVCRLVNRLEEYVVEMQP